MMLAGTPKLRLEAVERFERDVRLRMPFRFGVMTMTEATQVVVRVTISLSDGRSGTGVAAETLAAKWFDKDPRWSDAQNETQLRQAIALAEELYRSRGYATAFDLYADTYRDQIAHGAERGLNPLVASYGPALLDRAIIDALGRILGMSFAEMMRTNVPGMRERELTPDLAGFDLPGFLASLRPADAIDIRHTVGLLDPIDEADQSRDQRVGDGLPETLAEVARDYGCRWYKLKVGGQIEADLDRLSRIASVLDRFAAPYRATLDGNEQYDDVEGITELWRRMKETPALNQLVAAIIFVEQPIKRGVALTQPVDALARDIPLIIDESDGELDAFPRALSLGYAGVSSKNCKGFYKSLLNAARIAKRNAEAGAERTFMSGEDLTTWAGVSVQQDLGLVTLLGLTHVERNAHHFIDGMGFAPAHEQRSFAQSHPDLYVHAPGRPARLRIERGALEIASLQCNGHSVRGELDFASMRPMPAPPEAALTPANNPRPVAAASTG